MAHPFGIALYIPSAVFVEFSEYMIASNCKEEIADFAGKALREWLAAQAQPAPFGAGTASLNGYQWKQLLLPSGTTLRTVFGGANHHAFVDGDHIVFKGRHVSPNAFANAVGGTGRNAWQVIWLLFPNQCEWKLAAACRDRSGGRTRAPQLRT